MIEEDFSQQYAVSEHINRAIHHDYQEQLKLPLDTKMMRDMIVEGGSDVLS